MENRTGKHKKQHCGGMNFVIREMRGEDASEVVKFADRWIGLGYFNHADILDYLDRSEKDGHVSSLVAFCGGELAAIRITLAPGKWIDLGLDVCPEKWGVEEESVGYFKSLFVAKKYQQKGLGRKLSKASMEKLVQMGAKAVVCHSWLESPDNSSQLYLKSMGFSAVKNYPLFWHDVGYFCTGCEKRKCVCSAVEMVKIIP